MGLHCRLVASASAVAAVAAVAAVELGLSCGRWKLWLLEEAPQR